MIKFFIASLVAVLCSAVGYIIYGYFKAKETTLVNFFDFIGYAKNETLYLKNKIKIVIDNFLKSTKVSANFSQLLIALKTDISDVKKAIKDNLYLSSEEKAAIEDFFSKITNVDAHINDDFFSCYLSKAKELVDKAKVSLKLKGELYKKLCILAGVFLIIIIL